MSNGNALEQRGLLSNDASPGPASSSLGPFSARHRPGYTRVASVSFNDIPVTRDITDTPTEHGIAPAPSASVGRVQGLGINTPEPLGPNHRASVTSPVQETTDSNANGTPEQRYSMYSPPSTGAFTGSTKFDEQFDTSYHPTHKDSRVSLQSGAPSTYAKSDAGLLSVRSRYDDFTAGHHCASTRRIKNRRLTNWISVTILTLAVFSTAFSIIFAVIASTAPSWGKHVRKHSNLTPSLAAFLTSLFAKLIELSFVTVVVAFVGQALARRAHRLEDARGVTLAELSMRTWIMQPGTMLTNWESVRYAGITVLGVISLLATVAAILYTSAATALVQPQLKWPHWQDGTLQGLVRTQPFNPLYLMDQCKTPIQETQDPQSETHGRVRENSCLQVTHAALAYRNFQTWMSDWTDIANNGSGSADISLRPKGYALHQDNTTMIAPWIRQENVTTTSDGIIYNNVTMAMPHVGVIQAANDPINDLLRVDDFEGAVINIQASVPSPMINVLCVTMNEEDLKPFVWALWDEPLNKSTNYTTWPYMFNQSDSFNEYLNGTKYDHIFRWGPQYGDVKVPPVFPKLPLDYNTLLNDTTGLTKWGRTTVYLLGKGGKDVQGNPSSSENYSLCQMQAGLTALCSTHYNATGSGGTMEAVCEDDHDPLQYSRSPLAENLILGNASLNKDWPNIASEWARSMSLSAGINDGQASIARILTNFIVTTGNFTTSLPSMAEALAIMAGHTLIQSMTDSPFVGKQWNYTLQTVEPGHHQTFIARTRVQQYASGGNDSYNKAFFLVLYIVALMNILILIYFLVHKDWYTDFSEPMNLFSLAVNSPPSDKLAGSCGCGPQGDQYKLRWKLNKEGDHYFVENQETRSTGVDVSSPRLSRRRWTESFEMMGSPVSTVKDRFSRVL